MSRRQFIGRDLELARLQGFLNEVRDSGTGRMVSIRGRRQVGKSRLVQEFLETTGANSIFYTASGQRSRAELRVFAEELGLTDGDQGESLGSWEVALSVAANRATPSDPLVLVIDELPFLIASEPAFEGILQKQWDRVLEERPILLLLIGSDLSMMTALTGYGRPLYGRVTEMSVAPLSPAAISAMLSIPAAQTLDCFLVTGGFPRLASTWNKSDDVWSFLKRELQNPESPLIVLGERSTQAEFPSETKARDILFAIGAGERAFTSILQRALVSGRTVEITLDQLLAKRIIDKALPYSAKRSPKLSRYYIADPYLRFWLRFIRPNVSAIERGRGDLVFQTIREAWSWYAGKAIEPIIRRAVELTLPNERFGNAQFVGSFWNRDNSIEVDLVGGSTEDVTASVDFVGSIKWRGRTSFGREDLGELILHREAVPGATSNSRLVGVSKNGFSVEGLDVALSPDDIVAAFSR